MEAEGEAVITVRGKDQFIVLTLGRYNEMREVELVRALRETRADILRCAVTVRPTTPTAARLFTNMRCER